MSLATATAGLPAHELVDSLAVQLGYEPTASEVGATAQGALDLGWTDANTAEHVALADALPAPDVSARELHYLLLAACGAANIAGKAVDWLTGRFPADAVVEVSAIRPVGGRTSVHGRLGEAAEVAMLTAFVAKSWGLANLYYGVNPRDPRLLGTSKVATAEDIASRHQVLFDHDGAPMPAGERDRWEREVLAKHLREDIASVVRSGNGLQVIYDVEPITGNAAVKAQQPGLQRLYRAAGADTGVANADRVFRLPYTLNIPNAVKLRRGRTLALAAVHPEFL